MKGIIYKYTFPNGKIYIGQTRRHPNVRRKEHLDKLVGPGNTSFWEAYKKYGEPQYEELYEVESDNIDQLVNELNYLETLCIKKYKSTDPEVGYNIMHYGNVSSGATHIIRKKYKELLEEQLDKRLKIINSVINKVFVTKEKLTEEELYLVKNQYRDINLFQTDIDNFNFDNFANCDEDDLFFVEEGLSFIKNHIVSEVHNDTMDLIYNNSIRILQEERSKKIIVQIDKDDNIVKRYQSLNEICHEFNVSRPANVINVLKGKQKTAYGYYWKYEHDLIKE